MNGKFVSYLRVSTQQQGKSGLGLEAQREAVTRYLNGGRWTLVQEVVEVESGKRSDRPELARALSLCRLHRATLLVAKLDRLARNVAFVSALMEAGVKFVAVDLPDVNDMVVHILASVAQGEAKAISERTRMALQVAKARGRVLGGLRWDITSVGEQGRAAALQTRRENAAKYRADVLPVIQDKQKQGAVTLREISDALNADGIPTPRGGTWSPTQVSRVLLRSIPAGPKATPQRPTSPADDDDALIESAIRQSAEFADLWQGYSLNGEAADAALAKELLILTGNRDRVERLMHQSALPREEWYGAGNDYLQRVIDAAVTKH